MLHRRRFTAGNRPNKLEFEWWSAFGLFCFLYLCAPESRAFYDCRPVYSSDWTYHVFGVYGDLCINYSNVRLPQKGIYFIYSHRCGLYMT